MPKLKRTRKVANLGDHAIKVLTFWSILDKYLTWISQQKQKIVQSDVDEDFESPLFTEDLSQSQVSIALSDSALSHLLEDNDAPVHDLNGLKKWLTKGKKQLANLFVSGGLSENGRTKQWGPYRKKGTVQSVQTQQHNKKKDRDWAAKMKHEGFGDLWIFFSHTSQKEWVFSAREVLEIDLDSDEEDTALDTTMVNEDSETSDKEDGERLWDTPVAGPEQEEDNLGDIPDIFQDNVGSFPKWTPTWAPPTLPPNPDLVDLQILDLEHTLQPKRKACDGYMDPGFDYTLCTRLELMVNFLCIYQLNGYQGWIAASKQAASIAGKNPEWIARRLCKWTQNLAYNLKNLPKHEYGKFTSSILEDEDLSQEICLHLQSKGKYVRDMDIVQFLDTPEMKKQLNLKRSISKRTAHRWMAKMGYHWKKEPKGQYKDGHEREDVVTYRQNVFLPFIASIWP